MPIPPGLYGPLGITECYSCPVRKSTGKMLAAQHNRAVLPEQYVAANSWP